MAITPIKKLKKSEIVPIGNEDTGYIYLQKRWGITAGERQAIDEFEADRQRGQIILDKLIRKVAKDKNVTRREAQALLFPKNIENMEVTAQAEEAESVWLEYPEEASELAALNADRKIKNIIATIFIQGRVAYPVELADDVELNATKINVQPVSFHASDKYILKFGSCLIKVKGNHDKGAELLNVEPVSQNLEVGKIGFLYSKVEKSEVVGAKDHSFEDTNNLDEDLIDEIFEFYQGERSRWITTSSTQSTEEGNEIQTSVNQQQLTGGESTLESNTTESLTPDLVAGIAS